MVSTIPGDAAWPGQNNRRYDKEKLLFKDTSKGPPIPGVNTSSKLNKKKKKKASLQAIKEAIKRIAAEVPKPRPEQPYLFMRKIYDEFLTLRESSHWKVLARKIRRDRKTTKSKACFGYLIDKAAQGAVDGQKSKYITILTFARVQGMSSEEMIKFVKNRGKINKAVEHIRSSKQLKKSKVSKSATKRKRKE